MPSFASVSVEIAPAGSSSLTTSLNSTMANPGVVLELIAQAETKMKALELWKDQIHSDACLLLVRIKQERLDRAMEIEYLDHEVKVLRERSAEAERVARLALIEREEALRLCEVANSKIIDAEEKAEAAEKRAETAEEWLKKIQAAMVVDVSDELRPPFEVERS